VKKIEDLPPKLFNSGESVDGSNRATPNSFFGFNLRIIEPESPRILERMNSGGIGFGSGGGIVSFIEDLTFFEIVVVVVDFVVVRVWWDLIVGDDGFGSVFYSHFCFLSLSQFQSEMNEL
jgi:hypothetical protein